MRRTRVSPRATRPARAGHGPPLSLEKRKEQLERAEPVPAFEPKRPGRETGRHVEEVEGGNVALEEGDGLVATARGGPGARLEIVEAAVLIALGGLLLQGGEPLEDLHPFSGARGGREVVLGRGLGREGRGGREEDEEREEKEGGGAKSVSQPGGHANARPPRR